MFFVTLEANSMATARHLISTQFFLVPVAKIARRFINLHFQYFTLSLSKIIVNKLTA